MRAHGVLENDMFQVVIDMPGRVRHDFDARQFCEVPIMIRIKNLLRKQTMSFTFST